MIILLLSMIVVWGGLIGLWISAENRASKRKRIALGLLALIVSLPVSIVLSVGITQLDDQSYYAASVRILLDESIGALEAQEEGFLPRLQAFRTSQRLSYETRGNLLENVRCFHEEGIALRQNQKR